MRIYKKKPDKDRLSALARPLLAELEGGGAPPVTERPEHEAPGAAGLFEAPLGRRRPDTRARLRAIRSGRETEALNRARYAQAGAMDKGEAETESEAEREGFARETPSEDIGEFESLGLSEAQEAKAALPPAPGREARQAGFKPGVPFGGSGKRRGGNTGGSPPETEYPPRLGYKRGGYLGHDLPGVPPALSFDGISTQGREPEDARLPQRLSEQFRRDSRRYDGAFKRD
jgi:hypothetical protein